MNRIFVAWFVTFTLPISLHGINRKRLREQTKQLIESNQAVGYRLNRQLLLVASEPRFHAFVNTLLEKGAQVDTRDLAHKTPFHYAAQYGAVRNIELLLNAAKERKQDIKKILNIRDNTGRTPLHSATRCKLTHRKYRIAHMLLIHGACPNALDETNHTPLQAPIDAYRIEEKVPLMISLLLSYGAQPAFLDRNYPNAWNNSYPIPRLAVIKHYYEKVSNSNSKLSALWKDRSSFISHLPLELVDMLKTFNLHKIHQAFTPGSISKNTQFHESTHKRKYEEQ